MTSEHAEPGPLAEVACHGTGETWTLVFTRDLGHPPPRVWRALTEPDQLRAWAPFLADRHLGTPGPVVLTMIDGDRAEELPGEITRVEPGRLLEYTWGGDVLRWTVEPVGTGARLTLRHVVKSRELVPLMAAGWHLCLVVADRLLDGRPVEPIRGAQARRYGWDELRDRYADVLGIEPAADPDPGDRG